MRCIILICGARKVSVGSLREGIESQCKMYDSAAPLPKLHKNSLQTVLSGKGSSMGGVLMKKVKELIRKPNFY